MNREWELVFLKNKHSKDERETFFSEMNFSEEEKKDIFELALSQESGRQNWIASWILEKICLKKLQWLTQYFDDYLAKLEKIENASQLRHLLKITFYYLKKKKLVNEISNKQKDMIVEICFDTLIKVKDVAPKAFSLKILSILKKHNDWIYAEVKAYIEKNYEYFTPGLKASSKDFLKPNNQ